KAVYNPLEGPYEGVGDLPSDPTLLAIVNLTPSPMNLDGVEDGFYTSPLQQLTKIIAGDNPVDDDLGATWKGGYDADNLYVYVEVTDDSVADGDRVLILLDGGNEKLKTIDDNDALVTITADGTSEELESVAVAPTETGYAIEVSIPWSAVSFTPADSSVFGIEIVVEDSDSDGAIENRLAWQSTVEGIEDNPSLYGEAELREVAPPPAVLKTKASVELDGELDDAYAEVEVLAIDTEIQPSITDADDLSATWRSVYDEDNLYFYIEVQDDDLQSDNPDGEWFQDDGVEIYLDADNSKTFNSYDENDYQIVVRLDGSIFDTKGQLGDGAEASITETASGYIAEVKLPWTAIGATPLPGLFLGLDVHIIDDDEGSNRDGKLSWFAEIDQSFSNAALFGTVYLAGDAVAANRELPGKVEAESYLEQPGTAVVPSDDDDTDAVVFSKRGDYLEYEVSVQETGMYRFIYRVARESKGLVVFSLNQGNEVLHHGKLLHRTTANEWAEVEAYAYLEEGVQTLRIQSIGRRWKLNWFAAEVVDMNLPGQIEAEAFKERGNRIVVLPSGDTDETQAVSFLAKGAYVKYPVNIAEAGRYTFTYRVRAVSKKMEFDLQLNSETIHRVKAKRLKDSPFSWQEVSATADLPAGEHILRILSKKRGGSINWRSEEHT
ncbi:MAG: sugar-binding protein, partial [Bacteroidota bacterium]